MKNIADMSGYHRPVSLKQNCHLGLRQPNRLILQLDIQLRLSVFGLIEDHFASSGKNIRLHIASIFDKDTTSIPGRADKKAIISTRK